MKKKILCVAVLIVISLSVFAFNACRRREEIIPGKYQLHQINIDDLKTFKLIFGEMFLYSDKAEYINIIVKSPISKNLYYKQHNIEHMPELDRASFNLAFEEVTFECTIDKFTKIKYKEYFKEIKTVGELTVFYNSGTAILENELENRYISCLFFEGGNAYQIDAKTTTLTETEISEIAFELIGNMKIG